MYYIERRRGALMRKRFMHIRHFLHFWFFLYFFVYFFIPMSFTRLSSLFSYSLLLVSQHFQTLSLSLLYLHTKQDYILIVKMFSHLISFHIWEFEFTIHSFSHRHHLQCKVKSFQLSYRNTDTFCAFVILHDVSDGMYVYFSCVGHARTQVHQNYVSGKT